MLLLIMEVQIMLVLKLKKWGNSHGLILPKSILRKAHIDSENIAFEVSVNNKDEIILKSKKDEPKSLKELLCVKLKILNYQEICIKIQRHLQVI